MSSAQVSIEVACSSCSRLTSAVRGIPREGVWGDGEDGADDTEPGAGPDAAGAAGGIEGGSASGRAAG